MHGEGQGHLSLVDGFSLEKNPAQYKSKSRGYKMAEVSVELMQQLEQAQAELARSIEAGGPPVAAEVAAPEIAEIRVGAAGSGKANHVLVDHYFTSSLRRLWVYAGTGWRYRNVTNAEEQGLAQVAFASDRVDAAWDSGNRLTMLRCWKHF